MVPIPVYQYEICPGYGPLDLNILISTCCLGNVQIVLEMKALKKRCSVNNNVKVTRPILFYWPLYSLNILENQKFSNVFGGYRKRAVV